MSNDNKNTAVETPAAPLQLPEIEAPEELATTDLDDVTGGCETGSTGVGCISVSVGISKGSTRV